MHRRKGLIVGGIVAAAIMGWVLLGRGAQGEESTSGDPAPAHEETNSQSDAEEEGL